MLTDHMLTDHLDAEATKRRRTQRPGGALLPVALALAAIFILGSGPSAWAATTATVPRETPTRRATATAIAPTAITGLPTATAGLPTATTGLPTATAAPVFSATPTAGSTGTPGTATPSSGATGTPAALPTATTSAAAATPSPVTPPMATATGQALTPAPVAPSPASTRSTPLPTPVVAPPAAPSPLADVTPPGPVCGDAALAPLIVRRPDGQAVLLAPVGSITSLTCLYLDVVDLPGLATLPAGFRLGGTAVRLWATDLAGNALPLFSFSQPVSLSLHIATGDLAASLAVGYLGETSSDWALLETERDQASGMARAQTRWTGVYAVLARPPASTGEGRAAGVMSRLAPLAALALGVLVLVTVVLAVRRRRRRRQK